MEGTRLMSSAEYRNATRRDPKGSFEITDSMTGLRVGHLIDLSGSATSSAQVAAVLCTSPATFSCSG